MTMAEHRPDEWRRGWKPAVNALWRELRRSFPPTQKRREAFQLLAAALFYHTSGVWELADAELHGPAVTAGADVPWDTNSVRALFDAPRPTLFHSQKRSAAARNYAGGMHVASASGRLVTGLVLLATEVGSAFHSLVARGDWDRETLAADLPGARLGRCSPTPPRLPFIPDQTHRSSLAVILADRDRMGHGDVGSGCGRWRTGRTRAFNRLHECRIVEAQLALLWAGVEDLKRLGG